MKHIIIKRKPAPEMRAAAVHPKIILFAFVFMLASVAASAQSGSSKAYYLQKQKALTLKLSTAKRSKTDLLSPVLLYNKPASVVTIGRDPLYAEPAKKVGTPTVIPNQNCNLLPVSYKATYDEISFFGSDGSKIYPGAVFKISELTNHHLEPYTRRERNPMTITTNIISDHSVVSKQLTHFDYGSFNELWVPFLYPKLKNGTTGADYGFSMYTAESLEQVKQDQKLVNENNVGLTLKIPIPNLPVAVGAGGEVRVTNEAVTEYNASSKKTYCVIKFEQIFYNATANIRDNGPVFKGDTPADPDLVYVSKVEYGRIFIMTVESNANASQLMNAINYKLSNKNNVEVAAIGVPISGSIKNENSTSDEKNYMKLLQSSELKVSSYQQGEK